MGVSCSVFVKENSNIKATDLYEVLERICSVEGLIIETNLIEYNANNEIKIIRANISDMPLEESSKRQLCVGIFDEPYKYRYNSFEWFDDSTTFFEVVTIDFFIENEDLLFKIVYGLLKKYPNAKVWTEEDWFYTLENLESVGRGVFNIEWCYNRPDTFI